MTGPLERYLRLLVAGYRRQGATLPVWVMHKFVIRNGRAMSAREDMPYYGTGFPRQCFQNAIRLARSNRSLTYVEGFATHVDLRPWVFHHAWTIDKKGYVVDPTLQTVGDIGEHPSSYAYFGVPISRPDYRRYCAKGITSIFDTGRGVNLPFFEDKDPVLAAQIAEWRSGGRQGRG